MKRKLLLFALISAVLSTVGVMTTSCGLPYEAGFDRQEFVISHRDLSDMRVGIAGGTRTIPIHMAYVPADAWTAESNADWVTVTPNRAAGSVTVVAAANPHLISREAVVTIALGQKFTHTFNVIQYGTPSEMEIIGVEVNGEEIIEYALDENGDYIYDENGDRVTLPFGGVAPISSAGGYVSVIVYTGMDMNVVTLLQGRDWISHVGSFPRAGGKVEVRFLVGMSFFPNQRTGHIRLQSDQNYTYIDEFYIRQDLFQVSEIVEGLGPGNVLTQQAPGAGGTYTVRIIATMELENVVSNQPWAAIQSIVPVPGTNYIDATLSITPSTVLGGLERRAALSLYFAGIDHAVVPPPNFHLVQGGAPTSNFRRLPLQATGPPQSADGQLVLRGDISTNAQEGSEGPLVNLVNPAPNNFFHTRWGGNSVTHPNTDVRHTLQIRLPEPVSSIGFMWYPRQDGTVHQGGHPSRFVIEVSTDFTPLTTWPWMRVTPEELIPAGDLTGPADRRGEMRFINYPEAPAPVVTHTWFASEVIEFPGGQEFQYIRFIPTHRRNGPLATGAAQGGRYWHMAVLNVYTLN